MSWQANCTFQLGFAPALTQWNPVGGGCINQAFKVTSGSETVFVKYNVNPPKDFFRLEIQGLDTLRQANTVRIPKVIASASNWLALEWIETQPISTTCWQILGEQLSHLHRSTQTTFGFCENNYIGAHPQCNTTTSGFAEFFWTARIQPLIENAHFINPGLRQSFNALENQLDDILEHSESPSLIHGDLWSGNVSSDSSGNPVIYDPAVTYSHREMELAFTSLFGGFSNPFYAAYEQNYPLCEGYDERRDIYNLYPLLVHVHLFGTSYLAGVENTLKRFCH